MQRSNQVDVLKGIGIALVVLGHNWVTLQEKGTIFRLIYSFHMPLFFVISGIFIKEKENLRFFILNKASAILKPYFFISFSIGLVYLFSSNPLTIQGWLGILYAEGQSLTLDWMWFLPSLFISSVTAFLLIKKLILKSNTQILWPAWCFFLLIIGLQVNQYISTMAIGEISLREGHASILLGWPFSIDLLPITTCCILSGYFLSQKIINHQNSLGRISIALFLFFTIYWLTSPSLDLNERIIKSPAAATMQAICGIYLMVCTATMLVKIKFLRVIFLYLGEASIFIYIFHFPIQATITFKILKIYPDHPFLGFISGFLIGVIFPILIYKVVKKSRFFSAFLLPTKFQKLPRPCT